MEFLYITSLGTAYHYAAKIEQKFEQKKRDFRSANMKGAPKLKNKGQGQRCVTQNNTTNPRKDTGKWCEFHNSPTHSTNECWAKQSLVAELKAPESDAFSNPESEPNKGNDKGKQIIDADPSAIVATTKIQREDPEDPKEGSASSIRRCG